MSVQTASKGSFKPDSDVHITFEDQQRINEFARRNAKLEEYKEELKNKTNYLQSLEDAGSELELMADGDLIPFLRGELFIRQAAEPTQQCLEEAKEKVQEEIEEIKKKSEELSEIMSNLKTLLYAKFGNHINLEDED